LRSSATVFGKTANFIEWRPSSSTRPSARLEAFSIQALRGAYRRVRQVRALFLFRGSGALSNQWKRIMNFNAFWKWLCKQGRIITNLGETGNKEFAIFASSLSGTCFPTKPDQANPFKAGEIQHFTSKSSLGSVSYVTRNRPLNCYSVCAKQLEALSAANGLQSVDCRRHSGFSCR